MLKRYIGWPDVILGVVIALSLTYCAGSPGVVKPETKYQASMEEGIDFSRPGSPKFIKKMIGLAGREDWGRWSDQDVVIFEFDKPLPNSFILELETKGFGPNINNQTKVLIGGTAYLLMLNSEMNAYQVEVRGEKPTDRIEIFPPKPTSPNSINPQDLDTRNLGIGFARLRLFKL